MEHDLNISNDFWHKRKMYNFDPYNVLLAIAINIPLCSTYHMQKKICFYNFFYLSCFQPKYQNGFSRHNTNYCLV